MIGNIDILVKELCKLPKEAGWVEFKHKNYNYINLPVICWQQAKEGKMNNSEIKMQALGQMQATDPEYVRQSHISQTFGMGQRTRLYMQSMLN